MNIWDERAEIYDFVFANRTEDAEFYLRMAEENGGPVLEGGCATGRILLPIAKSGINVCGIDTSEPMLQRFRKKLGNETKDVQKRVDIQSGSLVQPLKIKESFSLIFLAFGTVGLFLSNGDALQVLKNLATKLKEGGRLIIERRNRLSDTYYTDRHYNWVRYWPERKSVVVQSDTSVMVDDRRKIREQTFFYDIIDADGKITTMQHRMYFREFSLLEMEGMIAKAGLQIENIYGNYDKSLFEPNMPRVIVIASKT